MSNSFLNPWRDRAVAFCQKEWPRFLLLAVLGFLTRLPALTGQLLWDDGYLARDNPFIKSPLLALEAFRHYLFLDSYSPHYRPVQDLSLMVDYYFWNTDPSGFHLTNILLHVASGLLLYRLLILLFRKGAGIWNNTGPRSEFTGPLAAFLIAALWIVHPVHSAAVDYISGRADSLAFLFAAGAWLLVLRARGAAGSPRDESVSPQRPDVTPEDRDSMQATRLPLQRKRQRWLTFTLYLCAAFFALLSLCSREIACIWIFLFLVHTLAFASDVGRKAKMVTLICCALVLIAYAGLRQLPGERAEKGGAENWSTPVRATLMLRALGDYGRLMVFPANLHMERTVFDPDNYRTRQSWRASVSSEYLSILGLGVFVLFTFGCIKKGAGQQMRIIGAIWFLAAYLPVSNIVPLNATMAEHWLYLPSVGFLIFIAGCIFDLPRSFARPLAAIAVIAIVALGVRSAIRSSDWRDEETFYQRTLAAGGINPRVTVNLAQIYARNGRLAEAEKLLRASVADRPDYPSSRNILASVLACEGKTKEAEALFSASANEASKTRRQYPRTWAAAFSFARMRAAAKDNAGAIAILERARTDYPQVWDLISLESELVRRTQGPQPALRLVEEFAQANWWHQAAALAEGKLYAENNDLKLALRALRRAALLDVHDTEALNIITKICLREHRLDEAVSAQRRAVARQPDEPSQYLLLSDVLDEMGRTADANAARARISQLRALAIASSNRG
ncbi:MAG: protein O-mannosyl-transferase [Verrucomicrobiota bacterium]|jgi:Flp pilus assembly protein TadD